MKDNFLNMEQDIKVFWDKRFSAPEYAYGKEPNSFFRAEIDKLKPGRILIPGAGEGRDAVYAATKGWEVYCLDLSKEGRTKAFKLADEKGVKIAYDCKNIAEATYSEEYFDAVGAVFFHLPEDVRKVFYASALKWLKPGGHYISELFTPAQLRNTSGGPRDLSLLATAKDLERELGMLDILTNEETETILDEGSYHQGVANVVRFTGRKK